MTYEVCPLRTQTIREMADLNTLDRRTEVTVVTTLPEAIFRIRAIAIRTVIRTILELTQGDPQIIKVTKVDFTLKK